MKNKLVMVCILFFASMVLVDCASQSTLPTPTTTPETATVIGRIILGYGDHSPVPNLPLWIGKESIGEPIAHTNDKL